MQNTLSPAHAVATDDDPFGEPTPAERAAIESYRIAQIRAVAGEVAAARRGKAENILNEYGTVENYYHAACSYGDGDEIGRVFGVNPNTFDEEKNCRRRAATAAAKAKRYADAKTVATMKAPRAEQAQMQNTPTQHAAKLAALIAAQHETSPDKTARMIAAFGDEVAPEWKAGDAVFVFLTRFDESTRRPGTVKESTVNEWAENWYEVEFTDVSGKVETDMFFRMDVESRHETPAPKPVFRFNHAANELRPVAPQTAPQSAPQTATDARETVTACYVAAIEAHPLRAVKLNKSLAFNLAEYDATIAHFEGKGKSNAEAIAMWEKRARAACAAKVA